LEQQEFRPKTTHKTLYSCQIRGMAPSQRKSINYYNDLQRTENPKLELREKMRMREYRAAAIE
jgi:hypothetical protein